MPRTTDKRVRLIDAAKALIHQQGFNLTTLADIAQEADIPLGNVYYYFKTKESIAQAVLAHRSRELLDTLNVWEQAANGKERLLAYVQSEIDNIEQSVKSGCPIGGLCQELAKQGGPLADDATKILNSTLLWVEKQLQSLGVRNGSRELALQFVAAIQGHTLLMHTFKEPKILMQLKPVLSEWIDKVVQNKNANVSAQKIEEVA